MGKTADLTVVQRTIVDTLHKEGKPQIFIAKEAGCSQSAVSNRVVTIYHDINTYDYHTVYICLSMVFGENKRCRISPAPRQQLST